MFKNVPLFILTVLQFHVHPLINESFHARTANEYDEIKRGISNQIKTLPTDPSIEIETVIVNLDESPYHRWKKLIEKKKVEVISAGEYVRDFFGPFLWKIFLSLTKYTKKYVPAEYLQEMRGIAHATESQEDEIILMNIFYEIYTLCTSIVAIDGQGNVFHARSMDFGLFLGWNSGEETWILPNYLKNTTLQVSFKKNNKIVYQGVVFVGSVGIFTGIKGNRFSISLNQRITHHAGLYGLFRQWLFEKPSNYIGFFIRTVLEKANDYEDAVKMSSESLLIAPAYLIVAGMRDLEGVVISRSPYGVDDVWSMNFTKNSWYRLQTNSDHWSYMNLDGRKLPGYALMETLGQKNVSINTLYHVLDSMPLRNKLTVYTTIMSAKLNTMVSHIKFCDKTCPLW